jgi:uncharacterized damage-inducible protein DinB
MESPRRRAEIFPEPAGAPRTDTPAAGDEHAMLTAFLRLQRETFALKCSGLDAAAMARRAVEPSTLSLLGLLRHLAEVERRWFRRIMAGQDVPRRFVTDAEPDADFDGAVPDPEAVAQAWAAWREEVAFAERLVAETPDLDSPGKAPDSWRGEISLRWLLLHLLEEYARHNGHADLLRERIDGAVGL